LATLGAMCPDLTLNASVYAYPYADCDSGTAAYLAGVERNGWDAVVGPGIDLCAIPMGVLSPMHGVPIAGYASSTTGLDDDALFKLYSRTSPSHDAITIGIVRYVSSMGWTRIGVLYDSTPHGLLWSQGLVASITVAGISGAFAEYDPTDPPSYSAAVAKLMTGAGGTRPRVIVLVVLPPFVMPLLAALREAGLLGDPTNHFILSEALNPFTMGVTAADVKLLDGAVQVKTVGGIVGSPEWSALDLEIQART
jgi:ABC-type branched-subunit amino acid transport system substrate-binding protein